MARGCPLAKETSAPVSLGMLAVLCLRCPLEVPASGYQNLETSMTGTSTLVLLDIRSGGNIWVRLATSGDTQLWSYLKVPDSTLPASGHQNTSFWTPKSGGVHVWKRRHQHLGHLSLDATIWRHHPLEVPTSGHRYLQVPTPGTHLSPSVVKKFWKMRRRLVGSHGECEHEASLPARLLAVGGRQDPLGVYQASTTQDLSPLDEGNLERSLGDGAGLPTDDTGLIHLRHCKTRAPKGTVRALHGYRQPGSLLPKEKKKCYFGLKSIKTTFKMVKWDTEGESTLSCGLFF